MANVKRQSKRASDGRPLDQVAALPFRVDQEGRLQILILSSRETHRAVIPKGWPMRNRKDWKAAEIEARQESGVIGDISRKKFGHYLYWKRFDAHFGLVKVSVFPLRVRRQLSDWPERNQRDQLWLPAEDAALLVDETDLGGLIRAFAESGIWKKGEAARPKRPGGSLILTAGA